ncbi:MAG: TonB-dependent receptor [Candidatus Didemnitutus sp.]|nr:TonB-dependent receptor [Candidatus Didemnitutus sp.]
MYKPLVKLLTFAFAIVMAAIAPSALAQGLTTSSLSGFVSTNQGVPISGATVTIIHEASGTQAVSTTRANGQYNMSGLRIGGPYTISVTAVGHQPASQSNIYLELGQTSTENFTLGSDVVTLDAFTVSADRDTTFGTGKMGTGSSFGEEDIANVTSVRRNIQDIAQLDSRMFLGSLDQGGQLSAQGQNFRFNSLLIDGVRADDSFGLNSNGFSSQRSPIPMEAIQSLAVELNPYDVRRAGFTGALLNAVIKSGTNEFHGSAYYEMTDESKRQKNPVSGVREAFDEKTFGFTFNGPLIRNKLFFSLIYDDFERTTAAPTANFIPNAAGLAQIDSIIARAKALGYDPGSLSPPGASLALQKTYIGKVDWNISDNHRATLTYRKNNGEDTSFFGFGGTTGTSLSSIWYQQPRNTESYNAQFFSQWTPDFRTEVTASYTTYVGSPRPNGSPFPQVTVQGISGTRVDTGATVTSGSVVFGTDSSRQMNFLDTKERQLKISAEYAMGDHTLAFGLEEIETEYQNAFVQATNGVYTFANPTTWLAGTPPTAYTLQRPFPGFSLNDAIARWSYSAYAGFLQDTWKPNHRLTIMAGLRYDYPYIPEAPPIAAGFATAGFVTASGSPVTANNTTNSGNATLAPRIGFTFDMDTKRRTQIRGGVGLFQGKNPAVWISNAYSNAGATANVNATSGQLPTLVFSPNVTTQPVPAGTLPTPNINITDPNFKQPALWKSNIAVDHKLPFGDITLSLEYYYNVVESGVQVEFLNFGIPTTGPLTLPDGRVRYIGTPTSATATTSTSTAGRRRVSTFADVFYMTNTSKGDSDGVTLSLARPMKNKWAWSAAWTRSDASEVSPVTSSVAASNFQNRASFNPNEDVASRSNTAIKDRIVLSLTRQFEFIKKAPTTVSVVYQGRTGRPYSWVFYGDANGDGYGFNDLLYVPTGPTDPRVNWASTTERDAFFAFVNSSTLANYAGKNAPRNSETSPWNQTIDLKFTQRIPIRGNLRAELYVNFFNFWNLFDKNFGSLEEVPFSFRRAVAYASYNAAGNGGAGQWNYVFNTTTLNGVPVTVNDTPISRWQVQSGIRIKF